MIWYSRLKESIESLWHLGPTAWNYRWWDYGYDLGMIDRMLELKEKHWEKHTHYEGDAETLQKIQQLRSIYKEYLASETMADEVEYRTRFLSGYAELLPELWD